MKNLRAPTGRPLRLYPHPSIERLFATRDGRVFSFRIRRGMNQVFGRLTDSGHIAISIARGDSRPVFRGAHRVVWECCKRCVLSRKQGLDHRNRNPGDNAITNLRIASKRQNGRNRRICTRNSSGYKGVSFHKKMKRWTAHIHLETGLKWLGGFTSPKLASEAYDRAAKKYFGRFACTNAQLMRAA